MSARSARAAAVIGPVALLLVAAFPLTVERRWTPSDDVAAMDALLNAEEPGILSIGNSKAVTDISPEIVGAIADPSLAVSRIMVEGSPAPSWYAILRYRVFGGGHHPKLVLVVAMLKPMLQRHITDEHGGAAALARMTQHFAEPDAVIAEKTLGVGGNPLALRASERRSALHGLLMAGVRDVAVRWFFGGGKAAEPALKAVFDVGAPRASARGGRAIPVVEARAEESATDLDPAASYLADIVALCKENGAQVVFVRTPLSPSFQKKDDVDARIEQAAITLLNDVGGGYIDMRDLAFPETAFKDGYHLTPAARDAFSRVLVPRLQALGVLTAETLAPAKVPLAASKIDRSGVAPVVTPSAAGPEREACGREWKIPEWRFLSEGSVMDLGFGPHSPLRITRNGVPLVRRAKASQLLSCDGAFAHVKDGIRYSMTTAGDGATYAVELTSEPYTVVDGFPRVWWVYPGTSLDFTFDAPWKGAAFSVAARVTRVGAGDGAPALSVGAMSTSLETGAGTLSGDPPGSAWSLSISSPSNGPYLAIDALTVGEGEEKTTLIGGDAPTTIRLLDDFLKDPPPPPALPAPGPITLDKDGVAHLPVPGSDRYGNNRLVEELKMRGCSPLRLFENGVPLPQPNSGIKSIREGGFGRYLLHKGAVLFRPEDGSNPLTNGKTYAVALDPKRDCRHQRWIYPGDHLVFPTSGMQRSRVRTGLHSLVVQGTSTGDVDDPAELQISLVADGAVQLARSVRMAELNGGSLGWNLDPPISARANDLSVEVSLPTGAPLVLLTLLALGEGDAATVGGSELKVDEIGGVHSDENVQGDGDGRPAGGLEGQVPR